MFIITRLYKRRIETVCSYIIGITRSNSTSDLRKSLIKMKLFNFFVFTLIALLLMTVKGNPVTGVNVQVIELEEPCVRQGGICVRIEDCDPQSSTPFLYELCPRQKHLGVMCCYI